MNFKWAIIFSLKPIPFYTNFKDYPNTPFFNLTDWHFYPPLIIIILDLLINILKEKNQTNKQKQTNKIICIETMPNTVLFLPTLYLKTKPRKPQNNYRITYILNVVRLE